VVGSFALMETHSTRIWDELDNPAAVGSTATGTATT
jgi:hypothetical protein